jgi:hypothetical protein
MSRYAVFGILGAAVALAIAGLVFVCVHIASGPELPQAHGFDLAELGVRLAVSDTLDDLSYDVSTAPRVGTVLHMRALSVTDPDGTPCELGVFYEIPADGVDRAGTAWTEESLRAASVPGEETPAQVAELGDRYLVFEPSAAACATEARMLATEAAKRAALWTSVGTATELPMKQAAPHS